MKLWPKSLWGQTLATTIVAVVLAQVLSLVLFNLLVLRPELLRVARATAQSVAAISRTIDDVPPAQRDILLHHLGEAGWIELWQGAAPPDDTGPRPRLMERVFMRELTEALGGASDLYWRTDHSHKLWMRVRLGDRPYWISIKDRAQLGPTGLMLLCALISATLSALVASNVSFKLLRPLHALQSASERMTLADLPGTLAEDGPDDIAAVSRSFNRMTARLRDADAERSLILAGISHDVRTPLTKLRLAFAMMKCDDTGLMTSAERQIDSIDRIMTQFLIFARGFEAETPGTLDPAVLLGDLAETYASQGVEAVPAPSGRIACRPEAVRRAVANLVENAVRYGSAPVILSAELPADDWHIRVRDHGPGIPADQLDSLRQPFVRGDAARSPDTLGTGLGLAIADKVARLHGGRLSLTTGEDGFEACLILPMV